MKCQLPTLMTRKKSPGLAGRHQYQQQFLSSCFRGEMRSTFSFSLFIFIYLSVCVFQVWFLYLRLSVFSRVYFCLFLFFLCSLFVIVLIFISNLSFKPFSAILHRYCSYFSCCYFLKIYYWAVCIFCLSFCPIISLSYSLTNCIGVSFFLSSVSLSINPHR
jgi:hypothetical protein